jgi:histone-lysine N-methyltransferase SETMAR
VTKAGATPKTQRRSSSQANGRVQIHHVPKKARRVKSNFKTMLICFFDANSIVQSEFVPNDETVNQAFYLKVLKRLLYAVRRKRPELWQSGELWLHHENAPAHKALSMQQFLTKNSMTQLLHPPYSPDLAPCDFLLFPLMKKVLKGIRFGDVEEVKKTTETLKGITLKEFQDCFEKWKPRSDRCIASNGQYFEGDGICNTYK